MTLPAAFVAALTLFGLLASARGAEDPDARTLAETERTFARFSVARGVRASFLEYFADDGLLFNPGPINARELMAGRPEPATKPPFTLNWQPEFVRVSRSGDFGLSTGPAQITSDPGAPEPRPPQDSHFLSIWKKRPDGTWRVAFDIGAQCPPRPAGAPVIAQLGRVAGSERNRDTPAEFAKLQSEIRGGAPPRFAPDVRLYFDGEPAAIGAAAASAAWLKLPKATRYEPVGTDLAASGDLGVTWGRWIHENTSAAPTVSWILQVWERHEPRGDWQVLAASCQLPPAATK